MIGAIGIAWTIFDLDGGQEAKLQAVVDEAIRIKNGNYPDPDVKFADVYLWLNVQVRAYMETIIPEG